jgi:hypothetical protein
MAGETNAQKTTGVTKKLSQNPCRVGGAKCNPPKCILLLVPRVQQNLLHPPLARLHPTYAESNFEIASNNMNSYARYCPITHRLQMSASTAGLESLAGAPDRSPFNAQAVLFYVASGGESCGHRVRQRLCTLNPGSACPSVTAPNQSARVLSVGFSFLHETPQPTQLLQRPFP